MSSKEISGFFSITPDGTDKDPSKPTIQAGNIAFKHISLSRAISIWDNGTQSSAPTILASPFKNADLLDDNDDTVGHSYFSDSVGTSYPSNPTGSAVGMFTDDYAKFRSTGTVGTIASTAIPRVFGSIQAHNPITTSYFGMCEGDTTISSNDVPLDYTQIGTVYQHPATVTANTVTTSVTAGISYVTYTNAQFWDFTYIYPSSFNLIRLESGADAGYYYVQSLDFTNNRLYLRNLNGTVFQALASATVTATACPGRRAYFNETGIIQLSTGTIETSGRFNPRKLDPHLRGSFILRAVFDKTGTTEAAIGTEQQGSYYITMRPYTHGYGSIGDTTVDNFDPMTNSLLSHPISAGGVRPPAFNFFDGGASAMMLDWEGQRVWCGYTNISNQSGIAHWRYKTIEAFREIANYLGTPAHGSYVTPAITLGAGDIIRGGGIGSNRWVYFAIAHASGGNAGLAIIKPDLSTLQYRLADGIPAATIDGAAVDKSRARLGITADVVTTVSTANLTSASGSFANSDIGRAIKVTGATADNGTYKISSVTSGTVVVVQTLAGGAVSFAGGTGGTFEIGDRVYLFFNNDTTGLNQINYMETMAPGTFLTRAITMPGGAGANCNVYAKAGEQQKISIDQADGCVYWLSNNVQQQINKYDPNTPTGTFSSILISNATLKDPTGGSGTKVDPTLFTAIHVNSKFDEIWVGSDQGHFKIVKSTFAAATIKRYFGTEATTYVNPTGFPRSAGSDSSGVSNYIRNYYEHADGRMESYIQAVTRGINDIALYSRESDNWFFRNNTNAHNGSADPAVASYVRNQVQDPYGTAFSLRPVTPVTGAAYNRSMLHSNEIQYQWDSTNTKWTPLEVSQVSLPNKSLADTLNPGCVSKPMHSAFEEVLFGVKIKFVRPVSTSSPNNEFLGRGGQTRVTASDGATTTGSDIFTGSGFVASDAGRIIRIESGTNTGIYKIVVFTNATTVHLKTMAGATFSALTPSVGSLPYTVWDIGVPGSNAGPENASVLLADGFGKDNTQDITGMTYESYGFKSRLHDNDENIKFAVENPIGISGSVATKLYYETYLRASPQYDAALSHHRALPGAEFANGRQVLDWMLDKYLDGTAGRVAMTSGADNAWFGVNANAAALGNSLMVDFGKDVQLGSIQVRARTTGSVAAPGVLNTITGNGMICNLYKANHAGGTPVASSSIRTSGAAQLSATANVTTLTLTSGDFLGSAIVGPNTIGTITSGLSTLVDLSNPFSASNVGKILSITVAPGSATDIGAYRIAAVSIDGSTITVRNLDQTTKTWNGSSGLNVTYAVKDGIQDEDMLAVPSLASPTHRLCVERLLSSTSVQVRTAPNASFTSLNWQCVVPTWNKVKRLSYNSEALPPDEANNGTWMSLDGREQYLFADWKAYFDLTDLTSAQNTGRYWKLSMMPRFAANSVASQFDFSTLEFYDASNNRLNISNYTITDQARTNADFLSNHINRIDFIQSSNGAMTGTAGLNGNVDLGGADGDTLTLTTGGNKFLGFKIGTTPIDGVLTIGTSTINSASSSFPASAILGRFIRIITGANAGNLYRVTSRPLTTQITVSTLSGGAVSWGVGETGIQFSVHEGIAAGGANPDKIRFLSDNTEYNIATINAVGTTLTITESLQVPRTNQPWEIIRAGYDTASITTDATKNARLVRTATTYPIQSGDMAHDSRGAYRFFAEDIGTGYQRADGVISTASNVFTGSDFSKDDEGRLLYIISGANTGIYEIQTYSGPTSIIVKNHYTGGIVTFTIDTGPITYQVQGDRRFRLSKYVASLRA